MIVDFVCFNELLSVAAFLAIASYSNKNLAVRISAVVPYLNGIYAVEH